MTVTLFCSDPNHNTCDLNRQCVRHVDELVNASRIHRYSSLLWWKILTRHTGIPLFGWLMDKKGFAATYTVIILLGCALNGFAMVPVLPLQIVTFLLWAMYRVLLFSSLSAYNIRVCVFFLYSVTMIRVTGSGFPTLGNSTALYSLYLQALHSCRRQSLRW